MFIRVYFEGHSKDIDLQNCNQFSIGSSSNDNCVINNADLVARHAVITNNNGKFGLSCNGTIYLNGTVIKNAELKPSQIYILSRTYKISMLVIADYAKGGIEIDLSKPQIRIGRENNNDIALSSPIISSSHAIIRKNGSDLIVQDQNSMNGTYVNGNLVQAANLNNGDEIIIGDCKLIYDNSKLYIYGSASNVSRKAERTGNISEQSDKVMFKRSPRLKLDVPTGEIEIQSPPNIGSKPEKDWIAMLQPLMVTVPMAVLMSFFGSMTGGVMYLFSVGTAVVGVTMSIRNNKKQTNKYNEKESLRLKKYTEHLEAVTEEIEAKRDEQLSALILADPDTNECFDIVSKRARRLWERRVSDKDFMNVRIGSGEIDFSMNITIPKNTLSLEEDELKTRPQEIYDKYCKIQGVPITCSLQEYPIVGVVGNRSDTTKLVKNMVVQIATHHCYTDVKIVSVNDKNCMGEMNWLKYLPHSCSEDRTYALVANTKDEAEAYFKNFEAFFKSRKMNNSDDNSYGKKNIQLPFYLFVITAPEFLSKKNPINEYLFRSKNLGLGIGVVFVVEDIIQLPPECEEIIEISGNTGNVYNKNNASSKQQFVLDKSSDDAFENFGKSLMPIYCEDTNTQNNLPTKYSFYEMLGIKSVEQLDIGDRWQKSDIKNSVSAPLGIYGQNELLYLDLHEKAHGSHGLVAGKTGSGKSEVLLSYLVAMASLYHPYEVQFVIIDFKGGGMSDRLERLPHLNTSITNIDGGSINRSLVSIKAEIIKRQKILAEASAKDIGDYIEKYKNNYVKEPLPHLIIVVDEFAELKAEQPEFMKELISASRIGRSLGVHLILATQSPAGVVDDQIWTNSNFKLSLMVLDESSSNAVLKSPLAAHIKNPGRGYLKVGNGELFELFQSGYSGIKVSDNLGNKVTQLDAVINKINEYCIERNIINLPSICLPPLSTNLDFDDSALKVDNNIPLGVFDNPKEQSQGTMSINVFGENTLIIGSSQYGKTNVLQSIIRSLTTKYTPSEVNIYIMDFASMFLKTFDGLNHVGGVVTSFEDEKIKNLFKLLCTEMEIRKEKQLSVGVTSFNAYKEAGYKDLPLIVVVIDNLVSLKDMYLQEDDVLAKLCSEGSSYGITFVATNPLTNRIMAYSASFSQKIALHCNDSGEYVALFSTIVEKVESIPGRCVTKIGNEYLTCQLYLAFKGEREIDRSNNIKKYIELTNLSFPGIYAKQIPSIPEILTIEYIKTNYNKELTDLAFFWGLDYDTVSPIMLDITSLDMIAVAGKEKTGKSNFIKYLTHYYSDYIGNSKVEFYIIDSVKKRLSSLKECNVVTKYEFMPEKAAEVLIEIEKRLESRYHSLMQNNECVDNKTIILIINSYECIESLSNNANTLNAFKNITGKFKSMNVALVLSGIENINIPYSAPEMIKKIKESRNILFFDDLGNLKIIDLPYTTIRSFKKNITLGDCYFIRDNECIKLKTPLDFT